MINAFFVNGFISTISATVVAKKMCVGDINILFVEKMKNVFADDYYELNGLIERYFGWSDIVYIERDDLPGISKKRPLKYLKGIKYYKGFKELIVKTISKHGKLDNIYSCMPSKCWSLAFCGDAKLNMIEHGMTEYILLDYILSGSRWTDFYKGLLSRLLKYRIIGVDGVIPSKFIFIDGDRSMIVRKYKNNSQIPVVSISGDELIRDIFSFFELGYAKKFPEAYCEMMNVKVQMGNYDNTYIYLPTVEVPPNEYGPYFEEQLGDVSTSNACVLIKNHYYSTMDISDLFKCRGFKVISFKCAINRLMPVELIVLMTGMPNIWGSYSSALLYSHWWLGATSILSEAKSSKVEAQLIKDHKCQVEDFRRYCGR